MLPSNLRIRNDLKGSDELSNPLNEGLQEPWTSLDDDANKSRAYQPEVRSRTAAELPLLTSPLRNNSVHPT